MKTLMMILTVALMASTANAAKYKCYASKYPDDMEHFFQDGYVVLNVSKKLVNIKYYYVNTVAHETTLDLDLNYTLGGVQGGSGQVADMLVGSLAKSAIPFPGDTIQTMWFDKALVAGSATTGVVGRFTFTGHGYSYDYNICYNAK